MMLDRQRELLQELGAFPDPRLRLAIMMVWAVLFLGLLVALRQKRHAARLATPFALLLYALFELGFAFAFVKSPLARDAWLLNTLFYLSIISFAFWALNRTEAKAYFANGQR